MDGSGKETAQLLRYLFTDIKFMNGENFFSHSAKWDIRKNLQKAVERCRNLRRDTDTLKQNNQQLRSQMDGSTPAEQNRAAATSDPKGSNLSPLQRLFSVVVDPSQQEIPAAEQDLHADHSIAYFRMCLQYRLLDREALGRENAYLKKLLAEKQARKPDERDLDFD